MGEFTYIVAMRLYHSRLYLSRLYCSRLWTATLSTGVATMSSLARV